MLLLTMSGNFIYTFVQVKYKTYVLIENENNVKCTGCIQGKDKAEVRINDFRI